MLIELGDVSVQTPEPAPPVSAPNVAARSRAATVTLVAIVALLLLVSSGTPAGPPPRVASLSVGSDAHLLITGSHAVIVDTRKSKSEISSYALPGPAREWSAPIVGSAADSDTFVTGDTIIVDAPADGAANVVQAFDVRTGRMLWRGTASIVFLVPAGLLEYFTVDPATNGVRVLDPTTGAARWSVHLGAACSSGLDRVDPMQSTALLETCTERNAAAETVGTVRRFDLASGAVTANGPFTLSTNPTDSDEPVNVTLVGDTAIVSLDSFGESSLTGFRTSDLARLWTRTVPTYDIVLEACRSELCITSVDYGVLQVLDPETGRDATSGQSTDPDPPSPSPPPALTSLDVRVPADTTLVVALRPGQYRIGNTAMPGVDFAYPIPAGQSVELPPAEAGNTWVGRLRQTDRSTSVTSIWNLSGFRGGCLVIDAYLACTDRSHHLVVWRLPS